MAVYRSEEVALVPDWWKMPGRIVVDPSFGRRLHELLAARGLTYRALAARTNYSKSYLHDLVTGRKSPTADAIRILDRVLDAGGVLAGLVRPAEPKEADEDEWEALELARRVSATDVGAETLTRLEDAVDDLASAYPTTPPAELVPRIVRHRRYVFKLLDGRTTLAEHRRLLVVGGWLSLLAATVHIDLSRRTAASANLDTARLLGEEADHTEIQAWCLETRAWDVLTAGDHVSAVRLAQQARAVAPRGSSAEIQATAQEGRAWARLGAGPETQQSLREVGRLVSSLATPDRPEHHYRYDPGKALAYTATTLSWLGDPAAEDFARHVLGELESAPAALTRPRRIVAARLDLGVALLAAGKPDEAAAVTTAALTSWHVVPSNRWRATEVLAGVERTGIPEAVDLRDALHTYPS